MLKEDIKGLPWQEVLAACIQKKSCEDFERYRESLPFVKRLFTRPPRDLFPGVDAKTLAGLYTEIFNEGLHHSNSMRLDESKGIEFYMNWQNHAENNTYLPLLICTYFDGSCYFQERKAFNLDGSVKECGIGYPLSECGVTGLDNANIPEPGDKIESLFRSSIDEVSKVLSGILKDVRIFAEESEHPFVVVRPCECSRRNRQSKVIAKSIYNSLRAEEGKIMSRNKGRVI